MIKLNDRVDSGITPEQLEQLKALPPASIGHVLDSEFMRPNLRPLTSRFAFCGPATTVRCYGSDSAIVHFAVDAAEPGDVIVVDRLGDERYACWGGGVSFAAKTKGIAGAVVDGMLTDKIEIQDMEFHVFGKGISAVTTRAPGVSGEINVPVTCGGVTVNPGDIVLADDDGILVLPPERVQEVIEFFTPRVAREPEFREKTAAGESISLRSGARQRLLDNLAKQEAG